MPNFDLLFFAPNNQILTISANKQEAMFLCESYELYSFEESRK